jgi:probable addiction module antidote protein
MAIELTRFDAAAHLADEDSQAEFLSEALATGDAGYIAHAIGVVARARGMSGLAADTGFKRQQLYRALSEDGNPTLETLTKVIKALGLRLAVVRDAA